MTQDRAPSQVPNPVDDLVLGESELWALTRYRRAGQQLTELHRTGFYRARLGRDGSVIVERAHYVSVCSSAPARPEPELMP